MPRRVIDNAEQLDGLVRLLTNLKLPITVHWVQGRDRSDEQNALQWLWANDAATQLGDRTAEDLQAEWKLRHGVPILRADDPDFRAKYDRIVKPLSYADKIVLMRDMDFPVTRLMKVRQMVRYMDTIWRECHEFGLQLTEPDPDLAKYQERYREKLT